MEMRILPPRALSSRYKTDSCPYTIHKACERTTVYVTLSGIMKRRESRFTLRFIRSDSYNIQTAKQFYIIQEVLGSINRK